MNTKITVNSFGKTSLEILRVRALQIIESGPGNFMSSSAATGFHLYYDTRISITIIYLFYESMDRPSRLAPEFFRLLLESESFGFSKSVELNETMINLARSILRWINKVSVQ